MRLKELRHERNLTQTDVADAIGTSQRNIGRWESGLNEPTSSFLVRLADFFCVSVDYILGREDDFGNVSVGSTGLDATAEELRLVADFRILPAQHKKIIQDTISALKESIPPSF